MFWRSFIKSSTSIGSIPMSRLSDDKSDHFDDVTSEKKSLKQAAMQSDKSAATSMETTSSSYSNSTSMKNSMKTEDLEDTNGMDDVCIYLIYC